MILSICRKVLPLLLVLSVFISIPDTSHSAEDNNTLFLKAGSHIGSGDFHSAIETLREVKAPEDLNSGSDFVKSRMQIAQLYHSLSDYKSALSASGEVLMLYPDNSEAMNFTKTLESEMVPAYVKFFTDSVKFLPSLLKGALITLSLVFFTMIVSPFGGLLIALGRISLFKPVSALCWFIIWLFRGTPLLLQLFFIYYGLPSMGITLSPMTAALIGLGLNYSAYLAEIIRAGILSIDSGQMEAAKAIGMTYGQAMRRVIIPQTYKRLVPPVGNEFIALIKDTALVSTIAMVELMRSADQMFNAYFNINVLILAAIIYLLFTTVFTLIFEKVEKKVGAYENR